jgi:hypothetical protein
VFEGTVVLVRLGVIVEVEVLVAVLVAVPVGVVVAVAVDVGVAVAGHAGWKKSSLSEVVIVPEVPHSYWVKRLVSAFCTPTTALLPVSVTGMEP